MYLYDLYIVPVHLYLYKMLYPRRPNAVVHVLPDGTGTCLAFNHQDLLHMSWNCNGLRARWRSGELMTLITEHKPIPSTVARSKPIWTASWPRRKSPERWKGTVLYSDIKRAAFETLRDALTKAPILAHPDWTAPFEVHTDASHKGLGAVLCHKIDGKEAVIAYASRAVSKTEAPWSTWELEALAMIWAVRHFKMYLYNTHFVIRTDSEAARRLVAADDKDAGGRLLR